MILDYFIVYCALVVFLVAGIVSINTIVLGGVHTYYYAVVTQQQLQNEWVPTYWQFVFAIIGIVLTSPILIPIIVIADIITWWVNRK